MADKTGIEWTDATWNPVTGCSKVSQGCKHCYAEREWPRMTKLVPAYAGRAFTDVATHADRLDQPLRWRRPRRVFVNSMSDLFHPDVPDAFIDSVFGVMWACLYGRNDQDGHVFQVLTKRADRMRAYFKADRREAWAQAAVQHGGGIDPDGLYDQTLNFDGPHPRIWLGVSVEDQAAADERIPLLLDTPAAVRWISAEPLISPVSLRWLSAFPDNAPHTAQHPSGRTGHLDGLRQLDWVVAGGESGPNARPMHPDWVRRLRDQCAAADVPFLFKQWGEWTPGVNVEKCTGVVRSATWFGEKWLMGYEELACEDGHIDDEPDLYRVGKKLAGRLLDGRLHDEYPEVCQ